MLNQLIIKVKAFIEYRKRKFGNKSLIEEIVNDSDPEIRKIAETCRFFVYSERWEKEEKQAFELIETIRKNYLHSTEIITVRDFGAGDSTSRLTDDMMNSGIESQRKVSNICKAASSPAKWCRIIFKIIRTFKPTNCLELGTSLGISAAYQIYALKLNNNGYLITLEGVNELAMIAKKNLSKLNYNNFAIKTGKFSEVLPKILSLERKIDFAFIDGHHDKIATQNYFEQIYPFLSTKSVIIFDDINWSSGMNEVWKTIYQDIRVKASFDMYKWGICLIDKNKMADEIKHYKFSI